MWHEARRREKATQKLLNEHRKRAEKRREENRVDPLSYIKVHGVQSKLSLDPSTYKQATGAIVAWQGDSNITIDRFDVRATLSTIPTDSGSSTKPKSSTQRQPSVLDINENPFTKKIMNYERYKLLIQDDLNRIPETVRLKLVAQSDLTADERIKMKLMNNRFGTANDYVVQGNRNAIAESTVGSRRGEAIPHTYQTVPPPASLNKDTRPYNNDKTGPKTNQILELVDNEEFEKFDLDSIDLKKFDKAKINEVTMKYGLTGDEFSLLLDLDKNDLSSSELVKELVKLSKKLAVRESEAQEQEVYGPALPKELMAATSCGCSDNSNSSSSSPVAQRSPRADIPKRNGDACDSMSSKHSSPRDEEISNSRQIDTVENIKAPELTINKKNETRKHLSPRASTSQQAVASKLDSPKDQNTAPKTTNVEPDRESRPRASIPLAYKRYARSSRSISRERHKSGRDKSSYRRNKSSSKSTSHRSSRRAEERRRDSRRDYSSDTSGSYQSSRPSSTPTSRSSSTSSRHSDRSHDSRSRYRSRRRSRSRSYSRRSPRRDKGHHSRTSRRKRSRH